LRPAATATTTDPAPVPVTLDPTLPLTPGGEIVGALPDGTKYVVTLEATIDRNVRGISGAIAIDLADGTSPIIGITTFASGRDQASAARHMEDLKYTVEIDRSAVRIEIYPEIAARMGAGLENLLDATISGRTVSRGRSLARWTGTEWHRAPPIALATEDHADCSAVATGRIIIWEDRNQPTMAYDPATDSWTEVAPIPAIGT